MRERMIEEEEMNRPVRRTFTIGACKLARNMQRRMDGTPVAHKRIERKTNSSSLSLSFSLSRFIVKMPNNIAICEKMPRARHSNERE